MSFPVVRALSLLIGLVFTGGCLSESNEPLKINKQVSLSPGHRVMPHSIMRATNGDLIVLGSTDNVMDYRAWATRLSSNGDTRWDLVEGGPDGWNDRSVSGQRFYGAVELADQATLLCGIKVINNTNTVMLVRVSIDGKDIAETLLPPVRDNVVVSLSSCHKRSDGILLMGTVAGRTENEAGTGWIAKLDWDFNLQWKKFNDDYGTGDFIDSGDEVTAVGWSGPRFYLVKIGSTGDILALKDLPAGDNYLVHGATNTTFQVVTMTPEFKHAEILDFDDRLQGPKRTLKLFNVGVNKALALPDGSLAIVGSQYASGATAAVTRVLTNGRYNSLLVKPLYQSPWYTDAVLTGNGAEIAAVRQVGVEQGVLDFISLK